MADGSALKDNDLKTQFKQVISKLDNILVRTSWKPRDAQVRLTIDSCLLKLKLWSLDIGNVEETFPLLEADGGRFAVATGRLLRIIGAEVERVERAAELEAKE